MASQDPATGAFVYYMPLSSGAKRTYSSPTAHFWCCVGSGMESHAKHGDSIYWEDGTTLYVNLFIPSQLNWKSQGLQLAMATGFPYSDTIRLNVITPPRRAITLALRLPGWAAEPSVTINGTSTPLSRKNGYAMLTRAWRAGDVIELQLPMALAVETMPDDPTVVAFRHGPVVLAAELEGDEGVWHGIAPALPTGDAGARLTPVQKARHVFAMKDALPSPLTLRPFFDQYKERTAVYFPLLRQADWSARERAHAAEERQRLTVADRTIDVFQPTDKAQERAHDLRTKDTEIWSYAGRGMQMAWWTPGSFVEASLRIDSGPILLRTLYWGEDTNQDFIIEVDGRQLVREKRAGPAIKQFVAVEYALPEELTQGRDSIRVRFTSAGSAASIYELRTVRSA
jgi:hypothetical protein